MRNVCIIAPHADDEVLGVGGTICKHVDKGDCVSVVIVADRAGLESVQRDQSCKVRDKLKCSNIFHLGLQDEYLDKEAKLIISPLEEIYDKIMPDIVYTCHGGDFNTDHQAVFRASVVVCRPLQAHPPSRVLSYETPSSTSQGLAAPFIPNVYNTLTADQLDCKIEAFELYTDEIRQAPNPRNAAGLSNYAIQRGMECNAPFAEAFMLLRGVG